MAIAGRLKMNIFTTEPNDAPYSVMYCAMRKSVPEPTNTAARADEYGRRAAYTEEEGEADLTKDVFVQKSYLHKDAPIT